MLQAPHSYLVVPLRTPPQPHGHRQPVQQHQPPASHASTSHSSYRHPSVNHHRLPTPPLSPVPVNTTRSDRSHASANAADVLVNGDIIGSGRYLYGELVREVSSRSDIDPDSAPARCFEVVSKLGTGSYAVVYLVRERLDRLPDSDDDESGPESDEAVLGPIELTDSPTTHRASRARYGRQFAIKCLSKTNLGEDSLQAQLQEATIHMSLPVHPNIVSLFRTLETDSFLLLLLEYVPGEDLFYFLEQARDHQSDHEHRSTANGSNINNNAPSNQDLSVTPPTPSLLSSFQPQQLLSHGRLRLIASMFAQMCDAVATCHDHGVAHRDIKPENFIVTDAWNTTPDGSVERRVAVKLTDFGLATTDCESADMECGSAPYMSPECRNNLAPTYYPRPADVWSLGIVLINMLYHRNPWADTSYGVCSAFELFRENAVEFFLHGFPGMTREVSEYLADSVFCILDSPDDTRRVSAREFGAWARNLPTLIGSRFHQQQPSSADTASVNEEGQQKRHRKRGQRNKGKGAQTPATSVASLPSPEEDRLDLLASANQDLVRQISRISNQSSAASVHSSLSSAPPPARKPSGWKGVFSLQKRPSASAPAPTPAPAPEPVSTAAPTTTVPEPVDDAQPGRQMSATASKVSDLVLGLSAAPSDDRGRRRDRDAGEDMSASANWRQEPPSVSPSRARNVSPVSTRPRANVPHTLGPSFTSPNWRNSMTSSTSSITTGFTHFSNGSARSVSTANTSLSASSWRTNASGNKQPLRRPSNIKEMSGIPYELSAFDYSLGLPPPPKKSGPRATGGLPSIEEGRSAQPSHQAAPHRSKLGTVPRSRLSETTTLEPVPQEPLATASSPPASPEPLQADDAPKKPPQRAQVLAKMLSALKR